MKAIKIAVVLMMLVVVAMDEIQAASLPSFGGCEYVSALQVTDTTITVNLDNSFTPDPSLTHWEVSVVETGQWSPAYPTNDSVLFDNLTPNTNYTIKIVAMDDYDVHCTAERLEYGRTTGPNTAPNKPIINNYNGTQTNPFRTKELRPTFQWLFSDPDGDVQSSFQGYLYNGSGTLVNTTNQVIGNQSTYQMPTSLARGVAYYWNVKTWDAEFESPLSDNGYFQINQLPLSPTITNPLGTQPSPEIITVTTPILTWNYSDPDGDAQTKFRINILDETGTIIHDITVTSSLKEYAVPNAVLAKGETYSWNVTVFDTFDEAATSSYSWFRIRGDLGLTLPSINSFTNVQMNGEVQVVQTNATGNMIVEDLTGDKAGWHMTVRATPFREVGGLGLTLPNNSLELSEIGSITPINGTTSPNPTALSGSFLIDGQTSVTILKAGVGEGSGTYALDWNQPLLSLTLNPGTTFVDKEGYPGTSTPYETVVTWTIVSGP